jgi:hypothetical protein
MTYNKSEKFKDFKLLLHYLRSNIFLKSSLKRIIINKRTGETKYIYNILFLTEVFSEYFLFIRINIQVNSDEVKISSVLVWFNILHRAERVGGRVDPCVWCIRKALGTNA